MNKAYLLAFFVSLISLTFTQAKIGYFWHITDLHYDPLYSPHGDTRKNCRKIDERGSSGHHRAKGRFGDRACNSPWALIESAAAHMRTRNADNVEFVLWTGDVVSPYMLPGDRLSAISNVTDLLSRTFSSQFVFPALGHADPEPSVSLKKLWKQWLPTEAIQTFETGGYYTIEQSQSKLRIVVLNTNLLMVAGEKMMQARHQWEWLERILDKSRLNEEMVYIVGHVPPGADEREGGALLPDNGFASSSNNRYLRMVRKYHSVIAGQFFGHLHSDSFRVMYSDKGKPISWAMLSPSVSPHRHNAEGTNPGLRLYKFDSNTGKVLDYTQFYLDLDASNEAGEADWQAEYNLTHYYNLHEVSAHSLHNLAERLTHSTLSENHLFNKYIRANSVRVYSSASDAGCDGACAHAHYCAIARPDYADFRKCVETAASALASFARVTNSGPDLALASLLALAVLQLR